MMARLFIAAWPPAGVRERIAGLIRTEEPDVRPVAPDNFHITLRFLGDASVDDVIAILAAAHLPHATAVLGGTIERLGSNQLVVPATGVDELATSIQRATSHIGRPDKYDFRGHLTVARTKPHGPSDLLGTEFAGSFDVTEVALVESRLLSSGAQYETVATFPTVR